MGINPERSTVENVPQFEVDFRLDMAVEKSRIDYERVETERILGKIFGIPINFILERYLPDFLLNQHMVFGDKSKLNIAPNAVVENTLFNLSSGKIVIEDYVFCGHNVCINNGYV